MTGRRARWTARIIGASLRAVESPTPCSERVRPRRVPLTRQPPIWLMVAVVVASLLPLMMQMNGDLGYAQAQASHVATEAAPGTPTPSTSLARIEPTAATVRPFPEPAAADAIAVREASSAEDLELCPSACDDDDDPAPARAETPETPKTSERTARRSSKPAVLTRATEACRDGDKKTARSTYRAIPLGDSRRKQIRKACRREGVWIL